MIKPFSTISILVLSSLLLTSCSSGQAYIAFAECLTDNGVAMYGAFWCSHCQKQKKMFGDAWEKVTYVECDPNGKNANPGLCKEKGVERYPTWEFPDGTIESGEKTFEELAERSTCPLPEEANGD